MKLVNKKSLTIAVLLSLATTYGFAANYTTDTNIDSIGGTSGSTVTNQAKLTVVSDSEIDILGTSAKEPIGFDAQGGSLIANGKLTIKVTPDDSTTKDPIRPKGLIVRGDSSSSVQDLDVSVTLASRNTTLPIDVASPDSNAAYAVAVGYDNLGGSKTDASKSNCFRRYNFKCY